MTLYSSNAEEIEALETPELIRRVRAAMAEGCIKPAHVFDMVDEVLQRLVFLGDDVKCLTADNQKLRKSAVAKCHCKHFKGLHENGYSDCIVVCEKYNDDYVSVACCQDCEDFELTERQDQR